MLDAEHEQHVRELAGPSGSGELTSGGLLRVEEQARVVNDWVETTHVRVSRRVVTEVQTVEVTVRREELVFTREVVPPAEARVFPRGTAPIAPEEHTVVLLREVPTVGLRVEPYERVTWGVTVVDGSQEVTLPLTSERVEVVRDDVPPA